MFSSSLSLQNDKICIYYFMSYLKKFCTPQFGQYNSLINGNGDYSPSHVLNRKLVLLVQ